MAQDRKLAYLCNIEKSQKDTVSIFQDGPDRFLQYVKGFDEETITENDYLKIIQMFYDRYKKREMKKADPQAARARLWCVMQIKRVEKSRHDKALRSRIYPWLLVSDEPFEPLEEFVKELPDAYQPVENDIARKGILMITLCACALLAFLVLVLKLPFLWTFLLVLALWIAGFYYMVHEVAPAQADQKMRVLIQDLDPEQQSIEKWFLQH